MTLPSIEKFKEKAKEGNLIPIYREILADMDTPVSAFAKVSDSKYAFLLESIEGGEKWARYSFLGFEPEKVITARGKEVEIRTGDKLEKRTAEHDPLEIVQEELSKYRAVQVEGLPRFSGGAVGYLAYDTVHYFEKVAKRDKQGLDLPDLLLIFTDRLIIFDNVSHKIKVVANVFIPDGASEKQLESLYASAEALIEEIIKKLQSILVQEKKASPSNATPQGYTVSESGYESVASNTKKENFLAAVKKTIEYIKAGDAFQVVLSQRFSKKFTVSPFEVYRALRTINPSPYMFFLKFEDLSIAGSSPEVLVRVEENEIEVRPIAGTRARGKTSAEDKALEQELLSDPKEISEHIMLVDLGRNDVGRVSEAGSVEVSNFMSIERYSHVMHIVSSVKGKIRAGKNMFDVFRSCFPAGTLSGAPKIRAMEIIEELEPARRGLYGGSIGFFSFSGNMDMCITIRTILMQDGLAHIQAGAGIVNDSQPELEYKETVNKARGMIKALNLAEDICF